MLILVELEQVGSLVSYLVALGHAIPGHPNFEVLQKLVRIGAADIVHLDIHGADMAFRPVDHVPGPPRVGRKRRRDEDNEKEDGKKNTCFHDHSPGRSWTVKIHSGHNIS